MMDETLCSQMGGLLCNCKGFHELGAGLVQSLVCPSVIAHMRNDNLLSSKETLNWNRTRGSGLSVDSKSSPSILENNIAMRAKHPGRLAKLRFFLVQGLQRA